MKKIIYGLTIMCFLFAIVPQYVESKATKQQVERFLFSKTEELAKNQYKNELINILTLPAKHAVSPDLKNGKYKIGTIIKGNDIQGAAMDYISSAYGSKIVKYMYNNNGEIEYKDGTLQDLLTRIEASNDLIVKKNTSKFRIEAYVTIYNGKIDDDIYEKITILFRQIE